MNTKLKITLNGLKVPLDVNREVSIESASFEVEGTLDAAAMEMYSKVANVFTALLSPEPASRASVAHA
jgi:hypothetical protein